jgi:tetratricopeptide (TPR) repeat protein
MALKVPHKRQDFTNIWDEIRHHRYWVIYWYYGYDNRSQAARHCRHLKRLLEKAAKDHENILGEECWSLVYEVEGDLTKAIEYREREIRLIEKLWRTATPETRDIVLKDYGPVDLSDRLDLLAGLYHQQGDLNRAIEILRQSQDLCHQYNVEFDGKEMLNEYRAEKARQLRKSRLA